MKMEKVDIMEGIDFKANKEKYAKIEKNKKRKAKRKIILQSIFALILMYVFGLIFILIENMPL